ncbi:hypothetical protein GOBAR_AA18073 [Gossypium barbadense]|uniref:Uncharacterized protein n=1 Tax=Gossypium barbadense TaxID=3634 RepID=A0A2P5XGX1_GOSBA|nr:hypothetical protein GOBAR_AA18073 [Gossypium barbadense]
MQVVALISMALEGAGTGVVLSLLDLGLSLSATSPMFLGLGKGSQKLHQWQLVQAKGRGDNASGCLDFNGIRRCWCCTIITRFRAITISDITCVFRARRRESKTSSVAVGERGDETSSRDLTPEEYPLLALGLSLLLGLMQKELNVDGDFEGEDALEGTGEGDDSIANAPTTTMKTSATTKIRSWDAIFYFCLFHDLSNVEFP